MSGCPAGGRPPTPSVEGPTLTDYAAVFRAMPTPYLVMTPDLVIVGANPAYLATTGRTLDDIVGRPVFEAFPGNPNETDPDGGVGKSAPPSSGPGTPGRTPWSCRSTTSRTAGVGSTGGSGA